MRSSVANKVLRVIFTQACIGLLLVPAGNSEAVRNVTAYGAAGNGTRDDTAAISRAIAALSSRGATLFFPCGTYVISASLKPVTRSHIKITGAAGRPNCAVLKLTGSASITVFKIAGRRTGAGYRLASDTSASEFTLEPGAMRAAGIRAGDYVLISDTPVASNGPNSPPISSQEVVKITAVHGDAAIIEGKFSHRFTLVSEEPSLYGGGPRAQKIEHPVEGVVLSNLFIDGTDNSGAASSAFEINFAVNTRVANVRVANFRSGSAAGGTLDTGYNNTVADVEMTAVGNGDNSALMIRRQTQATVSNVRIVQSPIQSVFSIGLFETHRSRIANVMMDAAGARGRPFKLQRASNNVLSNLTVKNAGPGAYNGISITDMSSYNIFRHCTVVNNDGTGIMMFGNFNQHNTFENCTVQFNTGSQFGQGADAYGHFADHFTAITGGNFCCGRGARSEPGNILQINSDNFTMNAATVADDQGRSHRGLVLNGNHANVQGNRFAGFTRGGAVLSLGGSGNQFSDNITPDGTTPSLLSRQIIH